MFNFFDVYENFVFFFGKFDGFFYYCFVFFVVVYYYVFVKFFVVFVEGGYF